MPLPLTRHYWPLAVLFENLPSITFFAVLYFGGDMRIAGWVATVAALTVCVAIIFRKQPPHPILLGINIYMLLAAPMIETLFHLGFTGPARWMVANAQSLVLVAVFLTGCALTMFSRHGFPAMPGKARDQVLKYSTVLLAVSFLSVIWTFWIKAGRFAEIGVPLMLLFGLRQFLIARMAPDTDPGN